jgi:hypothetical protein
LEELCVVFDRIVASQGGVFVFQGVEAMRAGRHQRPNSVGVEDLDVLHRLHLEQELVAGPLGGISRASFLRPQNGKGNPCFVEQTGQRLGDFLGSVVKTAGATGPKYHLGLFSCGRKVRHGSDF